ncbi:MAG: MgtC/SapB family protein [Gammaproteobacteria bacterium]
MDESAVLRACLTGAGIGLLMGLERERAKAEAPGVRTFALVALSGTAAALVARLGGGAWIVAGALLAVTAFALAAYLRDPRRAQDPGTTTNAALVLCYLLGALAGYGMPGVAVGLAVAATLLLYLKPELHGFSHRISGAEMGAILQLAAAAFLVLPLLPDRSYGPWDVINPFRIGVLVVLISALNFGGYAALKLLDHQRAAIAMGVLGGVVSSTATTLAASRHLRTGAMPAGTAALVVALANLTVLLRIGVIAAVVAPGLLGDLLPVLGAALLAGLILPLRLWRRLPPSTERPPLDVKNPADLRSALSFALLFALVLLVAAGVTERLGSAGLYAVAAVSGLTDVDAISLSAMQLLGQGRIDDAAAVVTICVAYAANLLFKLGIVAVVGGRRMALAVAASFAAVLAGLAAGAAVTL